LHFACLILTLAICQQASSSSDTVSQTSVFSSLLRILTDADAEGESFRTLLS